MLSEVLHHYRFKTFENVEGMLVFLYSKATIVYEYGVAPFLC